MQPISINGILTEWKDADSIILYFKNDSSRHAVIKALWDYEKLYISYRVTDLFLNAHLAENDMQVSLDDCVELYLSTSPSHARDSVMTSSEYQFLTNLKNTNRTARGYADKSVVLKEIDRWYTNYKKQVSWNVDFLCATNIQGTLNKNNDLDTGYTVEMAIYWSSLQFSPECYDRLLADFCVDDLGKDSAFDVYDWCNLSNFVCPKKWGIIELTGNPPNEPTFWMKNKFYIFLSSIVLIITSLIVGLFFLRKKQKRLELFQRDIDVPKTYSSQLVNNAIVIIEQDYPNEIRTSDIANKISISERHLQNLLKKETGKTFTELLNEIRCRKAKVLLESTNLTVSEISANVGYNNYSYFIRVFKLFYKMPPLTYREKFIQSIQSNNSNA